VSTPFPSGVDRQIAKIAADREHGASWLARAALRVVEQYAEQSGARSPSDLLQAVAACAEALIQARPGMAPIRFWMEWLLVDLRSAAENAVALDDLRSAISTLVASLVAESERAGRVAVENAVTRLPADSVVFTASLSQTVLEALRMANRVGKLRAVLAAESADASGHQYGRDLANALRLDRISVEVVADDALSRRIDDATLVWLGADSIFLDGSVLNGTPSRLVAEAAHRASRPVEIICESAKLDRWTTTDSVAVPPGFDRIPADLIDAIVTEKGAWKPSARYPHPDPLAEEKGTGGTAPSGQGDAENEVAESPIRPVAPWEVEDGRPLVALIAERLIQRQETVSVAESSAGGRICDLLTDRAGSSAWFGGGMIAYSNVSKQQVAGITAEALSRSGAVSEETALALAEGARRLFGSTWGIGETGIAGPQTGRRSAKPAGLTYVAVAGPGGFRRAIEVNTGSGARAENKQAFAITALQLLAEELEKVQ
jgi:nicotinamide-nucleotide amidase